MRRAAENARAALMLAAVLALPLAAQNADAPRAPRILGPPPAAPSTPPAPAAPGVPAGGLAVLRPPSATRLAPLPAERGDAIEEIVVIGQGWRLPDLGSEWRARQQEAARSGRFSATALPLYDPARPPPRADATFHSPEERRHGYIELFRLRFGRRSSD